MKKNLHYATCFAFLFLTFILPARAQMSGNVSIDASVAASSTNFKNWYSFWRSLQGLSRTDGGPAITAGISASVIVDVKSNLTEDSMVKFPSIAGMSATKTITIKGNTKYLEYGNGGEAISFQGGDYFYIQDLTIRNKGTNASAASCVRFYNNSDNNSIDNCILEFSGFTSGSTNGSAYIAFAPIASNFFTATGTLTGTGNSITNNICRTTNSSNPGPAMGITYIGASSGFSTTAYNNSFNNNSIQNFYYIAIFNSNSNGNQFVNNNISRTNSSSNNCNSQLFGMVSTYTYSTGRSTLFKGNYIHDLPYSGCTASNGVKELTVIYGTKNSGSSSYPFTLDSNSVKNLAVYNNVWMGFLRDNSRIKILRNSADNVQSYANVTTLALWDLRASTDLSFNGNKLINSYLAAEENYFVFGDSLWAPNYGTVEFNLNSVSNNSFYMAAFIIFPNEGEFKIHGNTISGNTITGNNGGYLFAIATQEFEDIQISNNLIYKNIGHDGFVGIYANSNQSGNYKCNIIQNTVHSDGSKAPSGKWYDNNAEIISPYFHTDVVHTGNIFYIIESISATFAAMDINDTAYINNWNSNTYYGYNNGQELWYMQSNTGFSFSDWKSFGISGPTENVLDPKFADISNNDFHSLKWQTQNDVVTDANNPNDLSGVTRNLPQSDRGVYEQTSDLKAVKTGFTIASSVCSGTYTNPIDITVKNLFKDTAYNFKVSYSVNGGNVVTQKVTTKILANDSLKITFFQRLQLSKWGKNRIAIYIDAADDDASNDSFIFITTVNPAPGGSKIQASSKPTKNIYYGGSPYDIVFLGQPWIYDFGAPRAYSNSDYGTKWTASVYAQTARGTVFTSGLSLTIPSGPNNGEVTFINNNTIFEDSFISVCIKFTDLTNGCDTSWCLNLYMNPIVQADFQGPTLICGSDTAIFKNLSYIKKGGMHFHWNFGTGNIADTSNAIDPWFIYSTPGTYKVKLTAYTIPLGYETYDSSTITVKAKPTAAFTRVNACEGELVSFTNNSTPGTSSWLWKFGDGTTSAAKDPTHDYPSPGQYTVKLYVTNNGCTDSTSLKAFEFPKPKAGYSFGANQCSNTPVSFTNGTTIASGIFASYWHMEPGVIISTTHPKYTFSTNGNQTVKLVTVSDFGCRDSITKTVTLKSAPIVAFDNTELCSKDATIFTNKTAPISGTNPTYYWNFGDGTTSTAQNPTHNWSTLGPKNVKLRISLDNGCKDSLTKTLTVKVQPVVAFQHNAPVCSGTQVVFTNNSTWASGNISFQWDFGDTSNSTLSDPGHTYSPYSSTNYNVQLCAMVDSACRTCATKSIAINEQPHTCDFVSIPDYAYGFYGVKCTPKNASTGDTAPQTGINYTWNFHNSGPVSGKWGQYNFQSDGTYNVTMCAEVSTTQCSCCVTKQVVMNRSGINNSTVKKIAIYPNPNSGAFTMDATGIKGEKHIKIFNGSGALVFETTSTNDIISVNAIHLANGIYMVQVENGSIAVRSTMHIMD
ncbi:MAG: PKD domain-containing protein [Bacteroidetes bacterium]|nr:PKD domain-containing protein [Bacteroidota bacterium]